ncbi:hypothetical protein NQZ68_025147 [Dissostichus eleginoides]|nr:hypothetical protein NQZ68_025147 [Dissostichus eleginoides]
MVKDKSRGGGRDRLTGGTLERANELNTFFNRFSSPPAAVSSTSHLTSTTQPGFSIPPLLTLPLTPPPHPIPPAEHTGLYHLTFDVPPLH